MKEKKSFVELSHLPDKFWEVFIIFTFVILISPFFSGMDFGVVKVPQFSPFWNSILLPIGFGLFTLAALSFYPFFSNSKVNNFYWFFTILLILFNLVFLGIFLVYPTVEINKTELDHISPRGVAHINTEGNSKNLTSNDFKIFVFTRIPDKDVEWWYDEVASTSFDPRNGNWEAEAIAGNNSDDRRICQTTEVEIIAIASTQDEMNKEFSKNPNTEKYIKYYSKFRTLSGVNKYVVEPKEKPICCEDKENDECKK